MARPTWHALLQQFDRTGTNVYFHKDEEETLYIHPLFDHMMVTYDLYSTTDVRGEDIWLDYIMDFRPESIILWSQQTIAMSREFYRTYFDVDVREDHG